MTEDCPGYDRDRQVCLIRTGDCEFLPPDGEAVAMAVTQEASTPQVSPETRSP